MNPARILVYGVTGSGKSTLAAQVAERTGLPFHSVDDLMWLPGWVEVEPDEQRRIISDVCAADEWVIDSAYGKWVEVPLARAELVVGLDYPRWVSLSRLLRRTFLRATFGKTVCNGNTETWRQVLSQDSIVTWHFRSFQRKRERIRAWEQDPGKPPVVRLTSPRKTREWLAHLTD